MKVSQKKQWPFGLHYKQNTVWVKKYETNILPI